MSFLATFYAMAFVVLAVSVVSFGVLRMREAAKAPVRVAIRHNSGARRAPQQRQN